MKMKTFQLSIDGKRYTVGLCGEGSEECLAWVLPNLDPGTVPAGGDAEEALVSAKQTLARAWDRANKAVGDIDPRVRRAIKRGILAYAAKRHPSLELTGDLELLVANKRGKAKMVLGMHAHSEATHVVEHVIRGAVGPDA